MTTQELEQLIEAQTESQNLDFKQECKWNPQVMVKDFLAMSNIQDGGTIIIGVREDGTNFFGEGVSQETMDSYKVDKMRDSIAKYTDPSVDFTVSYPKDLKGNQYVVIKIFQFRETPTLSIADIEGKLKGHTLYYRNSKRRMESAPISNVNDLRDLIELAALRLMRRRRDFGYSIQSDVQSELDAELNTLPDSGTLAKIMERGYWEVRFEPLQPGNIEKLLIALKLLRNRK